MRTTYHFRVSKGLFALLCSLALLSLSGCPLFFGPPEAEFAASTVNGFVPLTVTFTDLSEAKSSITSRLWDFGDGATSVEANPVHTYDAAGTYTVSLEVQTKFGSDTETKNAYITVAKMIPDINTWPSASNITFGQTLAASTLTGGAASVEGAFAFTMPEMAPSAGTQDFDVMFTPADTANYSSVMGTVSVTVNKVVPEVSEWPAASPITLGEALTASILSGGSASVPGTYVFANPDEQPSSGIYTAPIWFMPGDSVNYEAVPGAVDVTIQSNVGAIWYVTPEGAGSGTSWDDSFGSLQTAVDTVAESGGGEIWVAAGTYTSLTDTVLRMAASAHLYGGFAGTERFRGARDWSANETVIDGQSARRCVQGADDSTLDGFIVQNGAAYGGGGILNSYASPYIGHCTMQNNDSTWDDGGAMLNYHSSATITDCLFQDNVAKSGCGGGIANSEASPIITRCVFTRNRIIEDYNRRYGGGVSCFYGGNATMVECVFEGNSAPYGAGLYVGDSTVVVERCAFQGNLAGQGGAIYSDLGTVHVNNSRFVGNKAETDGGGIYMACLLMPPDEGEDATITLGNCVFADNVAQEQGGAVYNLFAQSVMTNCSFMGNTAGKSGGALLSGRSTQTITNCVFWANSAASSETSEIVHWEDETTPAPQITYSCVQNGYEGTGNIAADPLLIHTGDGHIILLPGSPCIDAGTDEGAPEMDIRGVARPQGAGVDMGVFEWDDSDANNLSDTWELEYFGALGAQAADDPDGDTWSNSEEYAHGTNPMSADTDGDGYSDNEEAGLGWDPTRVSGIRRVNAANDSTIQDGRSWATAFTTVQAAVNDLEEGEVWVAAGTYTSSSPAVITMRPGVSLFGGFAGVEISREERNWESNPAYIDGQTARRCVFGADNTTLDGFTIQNGYTEDYGGGIFYHYASSTVSNCAFINNTALKTGGGIYCTEGEQIINHCVFQDNSSSSGGGVHADNGTLGISDSEFIANTASGKGAGINAEHVSLTVNNSSFTENKDSGTFLHGGGIAAGYSGLLLSDSSFVRNSADFGGGVWLSSCESTVSHCSFSANTATGGGGAYIFAGTTTLFDCAFSANTVEGDGGALYHSANNSTSFMLESCVFDRNNAQENGGAVFIANESALPILNSIFSSNEATYGGAIYCSQSAPAITNCLFVENTADELGDMMCNTASTPILRNCTIARSALRYKGVLFNGNHSTVRVDSCILWANFAIYNAAASVNPSSAIITNSCVWDDGFEGAGNIQLDPLFVNPAGGDYSLLAGSPCIDAGGIEGAPETDLLGVARPQGAGYDMGAYEYVPLR